MKLSNLLSREQKIEALKKEIELLNKMIECKDEHIQMLENRLTSYRKDYYQTFGEVPYSAVVYGRCADCNAPITEESKEGDALLCKQCKKVIHLDSVKKTMNNSLRDASCSRNTSLGR